MVSPSCHGANQYIVPALLVPWHGAHGIGRRARAGRLFIYVDLVVEGEGSRYASPHLSAHVCKLLGNGVQNADVQCDSPNFNTSWARTVNVLIRKRNIE